MEYVLYLILIVMVVCTIGYGVMNMISSEIICSSEKEKMKKYYTKILNNVLKNGFTSGICYEITKLYENGIITANEWEIISNHFKRQKPKWYKNRKFYKHYLFEDGTYWWPISNWKNHSTSTIKQANEQRIEFLKHLILKLS